MITKQQLMGGIADYIDDEIIPNLPTNGKWAMSVLSIIAMKRSESIVDELIKSSILQTIGVVSDEKIDSELVLIAMKETADKYGKMIISVPMVGQLSFDGEDIDKLQQYLNRR